MKTNANIEQAFLIQTNIRRNLCDCALLSHLFVYKSNHCNSSKLFDLIKMVSNVYVCSKLKSLKNNSMVKIDVDLNKKVSHLSELIAKQLDVAQDKFSKLIGTKICI